MEARQIGLSTAGAADFSNHSRHETGGLLLPEERLSQGGGGASLQSCSHQDERLVPRWFFVFSSSEQPETLEGRLRLSRRNPLEAHCVPPLPESGPHLAP